MSTDTPRPSTPPVDLPGGGKRITVQRYCDACDTLLGDATQAELNAAVAGVPLPDATRECPTCTPAREEDR